MIGFAFWTGNCHFCILLQWEDSIVLKINGLGHVSAWKRHTNTRLSGVGCGTNVRRMYIIWFHLYEALKYSRKYTHEHILIL